MAWFSGNFPDFSEAVNKISAGVKTIEKNFDNALGLEENADGISSTSEGLWSTDLMSFMGQKDEDEDGESSENLESSSLPLSSREHETDDPATISSELRESNVETLKTEEQHQDTHSSVLDEAESRDETSIINELTDELAAIALNTSNAQTPNIGTSEEASADHADQLEFPGHKLTEPESNAVSPPLDLQKTEDEPTRQEEAMQEVSAVEGMDVSSDVVGEVSRPSIQASDDVSEIVPELVPNDGNTTANGHEAEVKKQSSSLERNLSDYSDSVAELEKVKRELESMETALQGAAKQAQAKADELAKLMNENEKLKSLLEEQKRKSNEAEVESLREEYHQRVSTLERKYVRLGNEALGKRGKDRSRGIQVYALTRERDTLRREQNKKSDAAALLKEKDEIITQVMAEGEELSKKQAAQEATIRKLRAQIREFEDEKKGLTTKLQVEENKVESIKRDKAATEKLKEAEERESMLVQTLEELRQTLSRKEQQAIFREDMLRRDIEDLQKRYQASERRCEELVTQVPESTRPLLRQIEAIQETTARKAEAWNAVERSLNSRLQEAEAKAAGAEERERSVNERLSQTLSRINVLEAQISCLRSEQTQITRSLEKERQRATESRQDYLALKEEADTHEGQVSQLQDEIRELKRKHKQELQEALTHRELLQQDVEREKSVRLELEKAVHLQSTAALEENKISRTKSTSENGLSRRLSSAGSLSSMEESFYLQASLDSSDTLSERRNPGETSYYLKSKTPNALEAALRHKEGELASYMSRLGKANSSPSASMESIRDSLAEELVKMTAECEKLRSEVSQLPGMKAEMEALRRRHAAALELMGERDEELEELRADIVDLKEMYREQVNTLVNK
ncbi:hypothetical protein M8C21_012449, partial [Ambrosia artemisiifolia]